MPFAGLYGSVRESHCALLSFSVLLGLAILLECSLAVSAFAMAREERLGAAVARPMRAAAERYGQRGKNDVTKGEEENRVGLNLCARGVGEGGGEQFNFFSETP